MGEKVMKGSSSTQIDIIIIIVVLCSIKQKVKVSWEAPACKTLIYFMYIYRCLMFYRSKDIVVSHSTTAHLIKGREKYCTVE